MGDTAFENSQVATGGKQESILWHLSAYYLRQKIILCGCVTCERINDQRCFQCWKSFSISCKCLAVGSIGFHNTVTMCDCFLSINVRLEVVLCVHISISEFMK